MGFIIGIGRGNQFKRKPKTKTSNVYAKAVEADGGAVESKACVQSTFDALNNVTVTV